MDLDYCKNIECSEYAIKNTILCNECTDYVSTILKHHNVLF